MFQIKCLVRGILLDRLLPTFFSYFYFILFYLWQTSHEKVFKWTTRGGGVDRRLWSIKKIPFIERNFKIFDHFLMILNNIQASM